VPFPSLATCYLKAEENNNLNKYELFLSILHNIKFLEEKLNFNLKRLSQHNMASDNFMVS
jgi:hypothetical protein